MVENGSSKYTGKETEGEEGGEWSGRPESNGIEKEFFWKKYTPQEV